MMTVEHETTTDSIRTVLVAEGLHEPSIGICAYLDQYPATKNDPVRLVFGVRRTPIPERVAADPFVHLASSIPGRGLTGLDVEYIRWPYSEMVRRLGDRSLRLHAVVACTGNSRPNGSRSLGLTNGYLQLAIDSAPIRVVEELAGMPELPGAAVISHANIVTSGVDADVFTSLAGAPDEVSEAIAQNVSTLIPSGATLALGVGRIADAVANQCLEQSNLRIVTGAITETARVLSEGGALDADAPIRGMSIIGDAELVNWAATDPRIRLESSSKIHDPGWLSRSDDFIVVLGALNVDRNGNINSEFVGGRAISGMGGAPNFARGAHLSHGGKCIIALPSQTKSGHLNLLDSLEATPTIRGEMVDAIATERGIAVRSGSSLPEWREKIDQIFC